MITERGEGGSIAFTLEEAEIVRAALFTIEHFMNTVWDRTEISAVSGFTVDRFANLRKSMDDVREAGGRQP